MHIIVLEIISTLFLFIEHVDYTNELEVASLNYAVNQSNINTSSRNNNSFVVKIVNSSRYEDLYQHGESVDLP